MIRQLAAIALMLMLAACAATPLPQAGAKPSPAGPPPPPMADEAIVCTADVQRCADGSYVSRDPDNGCAFKPCPGMPQ